MDKRQLLNNTDVISVEDANKVLITHKTFKVNEFLKAIVDNYLGKDLGKKWCFEGVNCEVLSPGNIWRKGKIKISLEFIADEPESPLDEIRNHPSFSNTQ